MEGIPELIARLRSTYVTAQLADEAADALTQLQSERDEVQASLKDWREGDKEGVALHMHQFYENWQKAESSLTACQARLGTAETLLAELSFEGDCFVLTDDGDADDWLARRRAFLSPTQKANP